MYQYMAQKSEGVNRTCMRRTWKRSTSSANINCLHSLTYTAWHSTSSAARSSACLHVRYIPCKCTKCVTSPGTFSLLPLLPGRSPKSRGCPRETGTVGMYGNLRETSQTTRVIIELSTYLQTPSYCTGHGCADEAYINPPSFNTSRHKHQAHTPFIYTNNESLISFIMSISLILSILAK